MEVHNAIDFEACMNIVFEKLFFNESGQQRALLFQDLQCQKTVCLQKSFSVNCSDKLCVIIMWKHLNSLACTPVPEACTIAKVSSNQSLQGWQSRATQLLSAGTPATSWHGRQLPWQPRMPPTNQQLLGLLSFSSMSHHVQPGHCRGKPKDKSQDKKSEPMVK